MSRVDLVDRRRLFEVIEKFDFDETAKITQRLLETNNGNSDLLFRVGAKAIRVLSSLKDKEHMIASYKIFLDWFYFCYKFEQIETTKNNIILNAIVLCKNLINEKLFELGCDLLNKLQEIYPFLCDNEYDSETERFIKHLAPLSYNQAINKELISKDIESAIKLFQHGVKFYIKVSSNFYVMFNSIRIFESNFLKSSKFELFYEDLFVFLNNYIHNSECAKKSLNIDESEATKQHIESQIFARKFFLSLFVQFNSTIYSNDLQIRKAKKDDYYNWLKNSFSKFWLKENEEMEFAHNVINLYSVISAYSAQFTSKKSSSSIVHILKENSQFEKQIKSKFAALYQQALEKNTFYFYWVLANLLDLFAASLMNYLNNSSIHSKYLQETLVDCLQTISFFYSENSKNLHASHAQLDIECLSKSNFHKPFVFFNSVGKLIELLLKTNNQAKCVQSRLLIEASESIIINQNMYLKWLFKNKIISNDDITKYYNIFESQAIRISNQFYSDKTFAEYIKHQIQSFHITIDRLKIFFAINKTNINDLSLMKTFRNVGENLILSLRLEENFTQAIEQIKVMFEFLNEYCLEQNELEWLVTNWCKIKRDMWKSKETPYLDSHKKMTIVDHLRISKTNELVFQYLFEELRNYYNFKTIDSTILMYDEIFYTLEKLESLSTENMLLKCRVYLEMALFNWNSSIKDGCKFKLSSDEYYEKAKKCLSDHKCLLDKFSNLNLNENNSLDRLDDFEENKENTDSLENSFGKNKKRLSSPTNDIILIEETISKSARKLPKRRRMKTTRSPMLFKTDSPKLSKTSYCDCTTSKVLQFHLCLCKSLCDYTKLRFKMFNAIRNLVESRMKLKDSTNILTNADNLHLQTPSTQSLVCPELCDEVGLNIQDTELIKELNNALNVLEQIVNSCDFKNIDKTLEKQFYESIDLLAQFYGFLGLVLNRTKCLDLKFEMINQNLDQSSVNEATYSTTVINLMKSYLNSSQLDNFEKLNQKLVNLEASSEINKQILSKKSSDQNSLEFIISRIESNKYLSSKPEFLVSYYLNLMHFYILKHRSSEAIKLMKEKILKSPILSGKQNAFFFEIKHSLKYLQFLLSMSSIDKYENEFQSLIDNETPLSLLEDCYTCIFSVAKYYTINSVEPFRFFSTILSNEKKAIKDTNTPNTKLESIFFDIGSSAECYRILAECMDIQQILCKYFIDIGRYRDATGYIREGLDITQLHFSIRRTSHFLLQQVNADLIATCFNEAQSRLKLVENLINTEEIESNQKFTNELGEDIMRLKNFTYYQYLVIYKEIKKGEIEFEDLREMIQDKMNFINKNLSSQTRINDYIKEFLIDLNLLSLNYLKNFSGKTKSQITDIFKVLKTLFKLVSLRENWNLAEYYCILFEIDETKSEYLNQSYSYIRKNPHPLLYRRILMNLFKHESSTRNDLKKKCFYLLETQSIALRHKACSIQLKHKRKNTLDSKLTELILENLSFNTKDYFEGLDKILPDSCCVISLILSETEDLYLIRLETKKEPVLVKLKFNKKLTEEFKTIMIENDRSMKLSDRNKFWTSRRALNKRLNSYLDEFETSVFSIYKSLLLGSYIDVNLDKLIDELKDNFLFSSTILNKNQENILKLCFLGLEHYSFEELIVCLKMEFRSEKVEELADYLIKRIKPKLQTAKRKHVCMLVDKNLHQIPFECFPATRNQPITRMPSIHFLINHVNINSLLLNKEKAFYIVDPGCDLTHTREKFQTFFEKRKSWDGIIGVPPNEATFKKALTEYELFIYTGHGSGSQYFPSDDVQKLRVQACSILMGCSSGNQYVMGDFEPYGTVLAYILAGCPCIVGNLWDVTDRDIDRLTEEFLESWVKEHDEAVELQKEESDINSSIMLYNSICVHLNKARKACKMAFLNGSAPIVYGLPVNFKKN